MSITKKIFCLFLFAVFCQGCNYFTYTPRSKKNIQREKPSIVLLNKIIDYREENNYWPNSREQLIHSFPKYKNAFDGFRYTETKFKIINDNRMIFYFGGHIKDIKNYKETQLIDLNSYTGRVSFYKKGGKFLWKLKMY